MPALNCEKILSNLKSKNYKVLLKNHENDFHRLMDRVHLTIGDTLLNKKPTDERLKLVREGGTDIDLASKMFQFGRYMLASKQQGRRSAGKSSGNLE